MLNVYVIYIEFFDSVGLPVSSLYVRDFTHVYLPIHPDLECDLLLKDRPSSRTCRGVVASLDLFTKLLPTKTGEKTKYYFLNESKCNPIR